MTFYAVELDICPAYGWQGGPQGSTRIRMLKNRHERRNANAELAQHVFTLPFQNITDADYLAYLKSAHMAMYAMTHSFLVKDWSDFLGVGEPLGDAPAGSTPVQLMKTYSFGPASRTRDITKPIAVTLYQGVTPKAGTFSTTTGLFTPNTNWTEGEPLTADFEFRVPVRFNNDFLPMSIDSRGGNRALMNGSVDLIEVFGE